MDLYGFFCTVGLVREQLLAKIVLDRRTVVGMLASRWHKSTLHSQRGIWERQQKTGRPPIAFVHD